jgi:hypothetical protein
MKDNLRMALSPAVKIKIFIYVVTISGGLVCAYVEVSVNS